MQCLTLSATSSSQQHTFHRCSSQRGVQELVSRGVTDPARVSVGGHSYGAFMAGACLHNAELRQQPAMCAALRHCCSIPDVFTSR
jgi:acetyl esterase/lipase